MEKYRNLPSTFYTVDYAELSDGTWKIIEAGDGQVSGLSDNQNIHNFYRLMDVIFE
ncbi:ATP-grasp domain-containing protein [Methanobrevibacter sp.]|uniref:ATP-grasp domain-containing protein n=1 Tax=Methanobrevibacter sp. TaxID=66852 RepID=UPI0038700FE1